MNSPIQPEELLAWMERATRGLAAESSEKVQTEILEHYELTREEQLARGVQPAEADRIALSRLGDARAANRAYRKVLLTNFEEWHLRQQESAEAGGALLFLLLGAAVTGTLGGLMYLMGRDVAPLVTVGVSLLLFYSAFLFRNLKSARLARILRVAKYAGLVGALAIGVPGASVLILAALAPFFAWAEWMNFRLRRKLPAARLNRWVRL